MFFRKVSKHELALAAAVVVLGVFFRYEAIRWNTRIQGDVIQFVTAARSLASYGNLKMSDDVSPYFYDARKLGGRFYEHYPLWPVLGAVLVKVFSSDVFFSLKVLSFFAGICALVMTYVLASSIRGGMFGLFCLALVSFSYILIDYSGNGTFYILQAAWYMLFAYGLARASRWQHHVWLGVVLGLSVLTNFQSVGLLGAYLLFLFYVYGKEPKMIFAFFLIAVFCAFIVWLPWGVRNYFVFGNPFFNISTNYVWYKAGVSLIVTENIARYVIDARAVASLIRSGLFWFPHNLYYLNRTLFVLVPIIYVFFCLYAVQFVFSFKDVSRYRHIAPVFLIVLFHVFISAAWPIVKFRYFVPLVPLVIVGGADYLYGCVNGKYRPWVTAFSLCLMVALSILTFFSTPTHTYYNGGSVVADTFGRNSEVETITTVDLFND